jgi:hypothetical protein
MKKKDQESLRKIVIIGLVLVVGYLGYQSMTSGSSPFSEASITTPPIFGYSYECITNCECIGQYISETWIDNPVFALNKEEAEDSITARRFPYCIEGCKVADDDERLVLISAICQVSGGDSGAEDENGDPGPDENDDPSMGY